MAINNWRYVVTGWYMNPDGTIVEETQYVPNVRQTPEHIMSQIDNILAWNKTPGQVRMEDNMYWTTVSSPTNVSSRTFSPAETYALQANWYYNQWDTALGNAYSALWSGSDSYSKLANQINDFYNVYANDIAKREMWLAWVKTDLANKLYDDMSQQRQYVLDTFWPNWSLTNELNKYYDDLWNYLATDAGRQAANIAAQWLHSGASLWAIRAQQNEAYNESFQRYVQAKEQEINAKQQIASNLINYMSTLRQEYWDTTNTYIISQYQRANDLLNSISASIAQSNIELAWTKLNNSLRWSWSWNSSTNDANLNRWAQFNADVLNTDEKKTQFNNMTKAEQTTVYNAYVNAKEKELLEAYYWNGWDASTTENTTSNEWGVSYIIW